MKKNIIIMLVLLSGLQVAAQSRKHISNFSQFQQYFNPALTGNEGSVLKSFYRDQWAGFNDAPRTLFLSGEVNLADIKNKTLFATEEQEASVPQTGIQHALGLSLLHDSFGPLRETQVGLNYSSALQLSETLRLRGGLGLSYNSNRLSGNSQVLNEDNDPRYQSLLAGNSINKFGANLGIALASNDFYLGYAAQNLVQGGDDENLTDFYPLQHNIQGGYRKGLSDQFGLILNGLYRYDANEKGVAEGQVKAVYNNMVWAGAGYRHDLAYTFTAGFRLQQFRIGYSREVTTSNAKSVNSGSNEIMVSYNLAPALTSVGRTLSIW